MSRSVEAAGTLPWRRAESGELEVALVHRDKYDDWSWPKGKLDPGERHCVAAARETLEETGLEVALGVPLPTAHYEVRRGGGPADKSVRYWAAQVTGGSGALEHEIDDIAWLSPQEAGPRLTYSHDREQLKALVAADSVGALDTWPLVIVRHARAVARSDWKGADTARPLTPEGQERSSAIAEEIAAFKVRRVLSSPSERCLATITPYAAAAQVLPSTKAGLSEEGFAEKPRKVLKHLRKAFEKGKPTLLCTHGPLLPSIFSALRERVRDDLQWSSGVDAVLADLTLTCQKGEVVVCQVAGTGDGARIVTVERLAAE